jgi:uncharacterized protein YjbI with pentapeptide repeats
MKLLAAILISTPFCFVPAAWAANPAHLERLRETNQCPNCDLSGANLEQANLFGTNLINANLRGANLSGANLGSANLTDADLSGANLGNAYLYQATLENTNLSQANLSNAYLREAILTDANLAQAKLPGVNLRRTNLVGLDFQGVDLSGANLRGAMLSGISTESMALSPTAMMSSASFPALFAYGFCYEPPFRTLEEIQADGELADFGFVFANLEGANLTGANLSNAVLIAANLKNANLSGANLTKTCLTYSQFHNATLDGANLKDAQLYGAIFENASLRDVQNADLSEAYRTEREARLVSLQTQAKNSLGAMNRAQQAYYLEQQQFATAIDDLGLGLESDTEFYRYEILPSDESSPSVTMVAIPKIEGLKSYRGVVFGVESPAYEGITPVAQLCEAEQPSTEPPGIARLVGDFEIECAEGSVPVY